MLEWPPAPTSPLRGTGLSDEPPEDPFGQLLLVALLTLAGGLLWTRVFELGDIGVQPALRRGPGRDRRLVPSARDTGTSHWSATAALIGLVAALAVRDAGVDIGLWRDGLAHGWSDILSAPCRRQLTRGCSSSVTLVWVAGFVAAELTLRSRTLLAPVPRQSSSVVRPTCSRWDGPGRSLLEPVVFLAIGGTFLLVRSTAGASRAETGGEGAGARATPIKLWPTTCRP